MFVEALAVNYQIVAILSIKFQTHKRKSKPSLSDELALLLFLDGKQFPNFHLHS